MPVAEFVNIIVIFAHFLVVQPCNQNLHLISRNSDVQQQEIFRESCGIYKIPLEVDF